MKTPAKKTLYIVQGGIIAALYVALTYVSNIFGLAYNAIQFRVSEALMVLPVYTPAAIPALAIGCFISNLTSPYGVWDMAFGTLATLLSAIAVRLLRKIRVKNLPILAPIPTVLINAIVVGLEIVLLSGTPSISLFIISALEVGAGELVVCVLIGYPLCVLCEKTGIMSKGLK